MSTEPKSRGRRWLHKKLNVGVERPYETLRVSDGDAFIHSVGKERLGGGAGFSVSNLGINGDQLRLGLELKLSHPDKVLVDLGEALLATVLQVLREELQLSRHSLQSLGIISRQLNFWEVDARRVSNETRQQTTERLRKQPR